MLYIITYATHNERYFEILKQSYPNIIVLGFGTKWNGFYDKVKATIEFCKEKNDDDLILFVDGFDSVILNTDNLIEKYKSFKSSLVFSKDLNPGIIFNKYSQDSFFNTCNSLNLNSGLYIGTPKSIIKFWEDIKLDDDDQVYATKKCNELGEKNIKIDKDCKIFYNYSRIDNVHFENNKIKINNEFPNIISAPAFGNIDDILIKLKFKVLETNKTKHNLKSKISRLFSYIDRRILDIIFLILIIILFKCMSNKKNAIIISFLLFCELLNYQLYLKHLNINTINKITYIFINLLEIGLILITSFLISNLKCDMKKLLLLNTIYSLILILFFIFNKCIFKVIKEFLTGINKHFTKNNQINYLLNLDKKYENEEVNDCDHWIKNNFIIILFIFLLNIYCFI